MREVRFYFADAAAQGYLESAVGPRTTQVMLDQVGDTMKKVHLALYRIVETFVTRRAGSYRAESE